MIVHEQNYYCARYKYESRNKLSYDGIKQIFK